MGWFSKGRSEGLPPGVISLDKLWHRASSIGDLPDDEFTALAGYLTMRLHTSGIDGDNFANIAWVGNSQMGQDSFQLGVAVLVGSVLAVENEFFFHGAYGGPGLLDLSEYASDLDIDESAPLPFIGVPRGMPVLSFATDFDDYVAILTAPVPQFDGVLDGIGVLLAAEEAERAKAIRQHGPRPEPRLIRSPGEAEEVAAEWLRWMGYGDAQVTPDGPDEGIDVKSFEMVAQVKARLTTTTRPEVQQHFGVAKAEDKCPIFFSMTEYTPEAIEWADRVGMALFMFDMSGEPTPVNSSAQEVFVRASTAN